MKRKATTTDAAATAAAAAAAKKKKPSPLLGKPQKFYAPSTAPDGMTREELSVWRKEERRKRNRASAAASRIKTQSKIAELEGQVSHWKSKCEDMEDMMMKLQRQVDLLTRAQSPTAFEDASMAQQQQHHYLVSPPSSHPNSPSSISSLQDRLPSIVTSSLDVKNFLAPPNLMLSPPSDEQTLTVENKADITSSHVNDSKKHLNMISRQAVKTGANSLMNNMDSNIMPLLPNECDLSTTEEKDSSAKNEGDVAVTTDDCATPDVTSVEMLSSSSVSSVSSSSSEEDISSSETRSLEDDDDLLDLLAETLDVDFDPDLLCFD
mmetsp:Transcript_31626/g.63884  ORF Transcript_31626/g.63884 Transcript_31626/m.63884 type:complete len:321 (+) Transcript_31626:83-1045(+)